MLVILGHILFAQFADYKYQSDEHVHDFLLAKMFSFTIIMVVLAALIWYRKKDFAPLIAVFGVSIYYVVMYGLLFHGTQYGLNGHWGDNGYRLAIVCKMMAYHNFPDAYLKGLTTMYPPLWFFIMAVYAQVIGIQAWQTVKYGYLFIFLVYPWLIYFSWRPLVSKAAAAAVAVGILFFAHSSLDYVYYEHITIALFSPWWLYFFEDGKDIAINRNPGVKFYLVGILVGSAIFLTYYYWFFLAIAAFPITLMVRYHFQKSLHDLWGNLRHKAILAVGITIITSIYWLPLIWSGFKFGFESYQVKWFGIRHANIMLYWYDQHLAAALVLVGLFFTGYLWDRWGNARLALYYCGAVILIIIDRYLNLHDISDQTRKVLQFVHVMTITPLAIGAVDVWGKFKNIPRIRWGSLVVVVILFFVFSNEQFEIYSNKLYKTGVNERFPQLTADIYNKIDCRNKVILTDKYMPACYYPFYMFTFVSNVAAHLAGQFKERQQALHEISQVTEPEYLAYMFAYNKFDKIDYVFLPLNGATGSFEFRMNIIDFGSKKVYDTISFKAALFSDSNYFRKVHSRGLYEVLSPPRNDTIDDKVINEYPDLAAYLADIKSTE